MKERAVLDTSFLVHLKRLGVLKYLCDVFDEIESLVLSQSRGYFLVISDNFAPWYIRKHHEEYSDVRIFRGTYFFTRLLELGKIKIDFFDKLIGTYSTKDISRIKQRYGNHE